MLFFRNAALLTCVFGVLLCSSCGDGGDKKVTKNLEELFGREVVVDSTVDAFAWHKATRSLRDTCFNPLSDRQAFKVVAYYNAKGCTPCRLKELYQWHQWQHEADSIGALVGTKTHLVLLFGPGNNPIKINEITMALFQNRIEVPVLIDTAGVFEAANLLPTEELYHYFLLDKQNRVLVVGSPINNPKIRALYCNRIIDVGLKAKSE